MALSWGSGSVSCELEASSGPQPLNSGFLEVSGPPLPQPSFMTSPRHSSKSHDATLPQTGPSETVSHSKPPPLSCSLQALGHSDRKLLNTPLSGTAGSICWGGTHTYAMSVSLLMLKARDLCTNCPKGLTEITATHQEPGGSWSPFRSLVFVPNLLL